MPEIKLQHVVSVSSEDKNFPAENLLKNDGFKKWKCSTGNEKSATVTLQFEKASEINQIDVGNEGSAFVEVLVGKSTSKEDSFQVVLVSSSFMNPAESRTSQNLNRVRIFSEETLSKAVANQKWDRVKVICTQPFAKGLQFGLSFVKFYSPAASNDAEEAVKASPSKQLTLGAFLVKSDQASSAIKAGSLFEKSRQKNEALPLTGAAAIRSVSRSVEATTKSSSHNDDVVVDDDDDAKGSRTSADETANSRSKASTNQEVGSKATANKEVGSKATTNKEVGSKAATNKEVGSKNLAEKEVGSNVKRLADTETMRRSRSPPAKKPKSEDKSSFGKLMEKVVFVLSGFQNPLRGELRDKAQEMGAKYKADWEPGCTHLICAFDKTPKYNQVKGKGRIVKKEWVIDCHRKERLLPWRQYRLGRATSPKGSESDDDDKKQKSREPAKEIKAPPGDETKNETKNANGVKRNLNEKKLYHRMSQEGDAAVALTSLTQSHRSKANSASDDKSDDCQPSTSKKTDLDLGLNRDRDDIFNASTDEEISEDKGISEKMAEEEEFRELPDFFRGKSFFLYGKFPPAGRRTLVRYITAYDGLIMDYMEGGVSYVVTDESWDDNFDQALSDNVDLIFVKSSWINDCNEFQKLLPHQKYVVTPK